MLVDANLRTPSLHELFALPTASRGLTDVTNQTLRGRDLAQGTPIPNLFVIQSGRPPQSPAVLYQEPITGLIGAFSRSQPIDVVEELCLALVEFKERYNREWLC